MTKTQTLEVNISVNGQPIRCINCGALLAKKSKFTEGKMEIKCKNNKCKTINQFVFK